MPDPELAASRSLLAASLLALAGGALDAFAYLNHGHVFAAAMTGNGVLLGIAALTHNRQEFLQHLLPLIAFALGILMAKFLSVHLKRHSVTVGLLCECSTLFALSWLPLSFPDLFFVPLIAFAAAYQIASFRTVDVYAYNSTFITANLRTAIDGLYDSISPTTRTRGLRQFRELTTIIASFLIGAVAGAILSPRLGNHTLWFPDLALLAVLALVVRQDALRTTAPR